MKYLFHRILKISLGSRHRGLVPNPRRYWPQNKKEENNASYIKRLKLNKDHQWTKKWKLTHKKGTSKLFSHIKRDQMINWTYSIDSGVFSLTQKVNISCYNNCLVLPKNLDCSTTGLLDEIPGKWELEGIISAAWYLYQMVTQKQVST